MAGILMFLLVVSPFVLAFLIAWAALLLGLPLLFSAALALALMALFEKLSQPLLQAVMLWLIRRSGRR